MTIASEITRIQNGVASAYSSVSTKGGTLPATQNLNNLPSAIESIPSGITPTGNKSITASTSTQTGIDVTNYATVSVAPTPTETKSITANGTYTPTSGKYFSQVTVDVPAPSVNPNNYNYVLVKTDSGIEMQQIRKSASTYNSYTENSFIGYQSGYQGDLTIVGVNLNYATEIGTGRCERMFRNCTNLVSAKFNTIQKFVSAYNSVFWMFRNTGVKEVSFPVLKEIAGGSGGMFYECQYLTTATFNELDTFTGTYGKTALKSFFQSCLLLANVYFYALKTSSFSTYIDQLQNMFDSNTALTSGTCTVHFPSNLSSTIAGLTGYPTFGGDASRIVLAFDLPQTS